VFILHNMYKDRRTDAEAVGEHGMRRRAYSSNHGPARDGLGVKGSAPVRAKRARQNVVERVLAAGTQMQMDIRHYMHCGGAGCGRGRGAGSEDINMSKTSPAAAMSTQRIRCVKMPCLPAAHAGLRALSRCAPTRSCLIRRVD
jgi:hypothetical protein